MSPTQVHPPDAQADVVFTTTLGRVHSQWLEEVHRHLSPACDPHSGFWNRWAATRFLADRFAPAYRIQAELLDVLLDQLDPHAAGRLVDDRRMIDRLRADFDELAPERGSGIAAAAIACSLLATLQRWYRELEQAVTALPAHGVPRQAMELVARLEGSAPQ